MRFPLYVQVTKPPTSSKPPPKRLGSQKPAQMSGSAAAAVGSTEATIAEVCGYSDTSVVHIKLTWVCVVIVFGYKGWT